MKHILACFALLLGVHALAAPAATNDAAYWLTSYDGSELKTGTFQCRSPRFPSLSTQNDEINAITERMRNWQECYNRFVTNMNAAPAPEALIPKDVLERMTPGEREQAAARIKLVRNEIAQSSSVKAKIIMADFSAWRAATEAYVNEHNEVTRRARENDGGPEGELRRNNYAPKGE